jgi:branched-chain amino acid transport system ATP-binding protein
MRARVLELRGVETSYGITAVLRGVSLAVPDGAIVALLGGNGAGKTTTLNTISGLLKATAGSITLDGNPITGITPNRIVMRGIAHVPQGREVFPSLSVQENLELGAVTRRNGPEVRRDLERVYATFPRLKERHRQVAGSLSGGEQQMLAIGRGIMARPRILMLDEPSMGLAPLIVEELSDVMADLNRGGLTILLVEQNVGIALSLAGYAYILQDGTIATSGSTEELGKNPELVSFYLGGSRV